jgi:hypothetical protein
MHHCDWVATIVEGAAKGKLLPDGDGTPMDSINMWNSLMDPKELSESPRKDVVMNIDPTNQGTVENDPGGWSGAHMLRLYLGFPKLELHRCPRSENVDLCGRVRWNSRGRFQACPWLAGRARQLVLAQPK